MCRTHWWSSSFNLLLIWSDTGSLASVDLQRCETTHSKEKEQYLIYLSAYRTALAETDVTKLESEWTEVDKKWMDIRHWVQMCIPHSLELAKQQSPTLDFRQFWKNSLHLSYRASESHFGHLGIDSLSLALVIWMHLVWVKAASTCNGSYDMVKPPKLAIWMRIVFEGGREHLQNMRETKWL